MLDQPTVDVRPEMTAHRPGDEVALLVDTSRSTTGSVTVTHLGTHTLTAVVKLDSGRTRIPLGPLDIGSYAVRLVTASGQATTAFDVLDDPIARPRYGFLADFRPGRDDALAVADSLRAFHLNVVQLYDWMYRHAELAPPADEFEDALGRPLSLASVRSMLDTVHEVGALALGYATVYGAGEEYAAAHPYQVLHRRGGTAWMLADFLWVMDVSAGSEWSRHIVGQMVEAVRDVGFDGLHLDQYGDPKVALTTSGAVVDLADAFPAFIDAVRAALPEATLIFNNVNDFPTRRTVLANQNATYIEVWPPHDDYADLVRLVDVARDLAPHRPVILAAYLTPFATAGGEHELATAKLALATVWAAGGQYLLLGETHGILVDPYYPRFATLAAVAVRTLRAFADFAVANGDLLFDPAAGESSGSWALGIHDQVVVTGARTSTRPQAGSVWVRTSSAGRRLVVQLVDYRDQAEARWNATREPTQPVTGLTVTLPAVSDKPTVWFGTPAAGPDLVPLSVSDNPDLVVVEIPAFDTWALLLVDC
ncbi:MAG: glycoside hydrolase family 66 protein [Actinomycetota bacterium]|nr:glycoside hydrolase family 66 protein [Actinomycetota bacterium]